MTDPDSVVLECGKTLEEISDYLAADRQPYDASIETCPECLNALDSLERMGELSRSLIASDALHLPPPPASWFGRIMDVVRTEVRAGRSLPVHHPDPRVTITITEGAVRSLVRAVGDGIDGLYLGRIEIEGDAEEPGAPVEIAVTATAAWNVSMPELAAELREAVFAALAQHTDLTVTAVNVAVEDVHGWQNRKDAS
ncbi:Asp23/Gls24 family envelope stress response protein [Microbacterium sp. P04]|uniref:Asp23/Gls24 family envelope stress response protein n=1 Tax=Microbacterium sp. P04 TaxID=3366947 RepID=UPI003744DA74